jgi:O-antigen/teichoic acid export membrane protein
MLAKEQIVSGITWNGLSRLLNGAMQMAFTIFLARLLDPSDFGLIAMVLVVAGFAGLFGDPGFAAALIQRKEIEERHLSSVFWMNILIGILLAGLFLSFSPLMAIFYHAPQLSLLGAFISALFIINAFKIVPYAILNRSLAFRKLAFVDTLTTLIAGITAVTLAREGFGAWSLAWQVVVSAFVSVVMIWGVSGWRPRLSFDPNAVRELLRFSMNLLGFNVYHYWVKNIDNLLIGGFIGSAGLGLYSKAYEILLLPINQITSTVGQVMIPSLSKIKDDRERFKKVYLEAVSGVAFIAFPLMLGLLVVADSFVLGLYGEKWSEAIPILRVFCILGVIYSIAATAGWIYTAQGRTDLLFLWGLASGAVIMLSIVVGVIIGTPLAVALSLAIVGGAIHVYPQFTIPGKLIGMELRDVLRSIADVFICSVIMACVVWLIGLIFPSSVSHLTRLLLQVPLGIVTYGLLVYTLRIRSCVSLLSLVKGSKVPA